MLGTIFYFSEEPRCHRPEGQENHTFLVRRADAGPGGHGFGGAAGHFGDDPFIGAGAVGPGGAGDLDVRVAVWVKCREGGGLRSEPTVPSTTRNHQHY